MILRQPERGIDPARACVGQRYAAIHAHEGIVQSQARISLVMAKPNRPSARCFCMQLPGEIARLVPFIGKGRDLARHEGFHTLSRKALRSGCIERVLHQAFTIHPC